MKPTPLARAAAPPPPTERTLAGHRRAYLVGIEGVGMSGAAELLRARGLSVRGSDRAPGERSARLARLGVAVEPGEDPRALLDCDLLVRSAAVPDRHPQVEAARARGLPVWKYAELLGALMAERFAVCVAGCHGKTTTSALVASVLLDAGADPSFLVGGDLRSVGTGARAGAGPHFVAESCEFDRSFLVHRPTVAIVTNVDEDHLDYYRDLAEIQEAFRAFARRLPADGLLVVNEAYAPLFDDVGARVATFGFGPEATWSSGEPEQRGAMTVFPLAREGTSLGEIEIPIPGAHSVLNATAAVAALDASGLGLEAIRRGLAGFCGVGRRLEVVGEHRGVLVLDDYGHHPVEIRAVVRALRSRYPGRRLVLVFQPHQASRTRCLLDEFAAALADVDEVWVPPIYFARDSDEERRLVTSADLAARVQGGGGRAVLLDDLDAAVEHGTRELRDGDVVVTMGAGDVDRVARGLVRRLR